MKLDVSGYDIIYISNLCFNHTFNIMHTPLACFINNITGA